MTDKERYVTKIVAVLVLVIGVSFAYFIAEVHDEKKIDVNVVSDKLDSLTYTVDKDINLSINQFNLANGKENVSDSSVATVSFLANKTSNQAETFYNIYFYIESNPYVYTTKDKKPEIILNVYDKDNNEIKTIDGLDYVSATNSKGTTLNGFDITDKAGLFKVSLNNKITANSSIMPTKQTWKVTLTYINLENNQIANENKTLKANIILNDKIYKASISDVCQNGDNLANCIISYHDSGEAIATNIYHHDGTLENNINDNSYRYAGAANAVKNFVCFGSDADSCPYDNLYRIIGVIDGKVKLIKYDYANSNLLGTDGSYSSSIYKKKERPTYKGNHETIHKYSRNSVISDNTWSESNLNKINLNTNFINNIGEKWASKIVETNWKVGGNTVENITITRPSVVYQNEIINPMSNTTDSKTEYKAKIGLMYVSDYGFAADPSAWTTKLGYYYDAKAKNWMHMGLDEWTITRVANTSDLTFDVESAGSLSGNTSSSVVYSSDYAYNHHLSTTGVDSYNGVRPSFSLSSSTTYKLGQGTATDPIRIN